jgi:hypothetical protein
VWVCGMPIELARAEEAGPVLKVLVKPNAMDGEPEDPEIATLSKEGSDAERICFRDGPVLTIPNVALVPELLDRVLLRSSVTIRRCFSASERTLHRDLFVA